jgi:hypothetical protein
VYDTDTNHGFLRTPKGRIIAFDPKSSTNTGAFSINAAGMITGYFEDSAEMFHGFVRNPG